MQDITHVLIVEDDPMVAELNRRYLARITGFTCAGVVNSVEQAMQIVDRKTVDLILLDVYMPDTNGLEFLAELRKAHRKIDVIMVTAARDATNIEEALRLGAVDYLVKPFEYERLEEALEVYRRRRSTVHCEKQLSQAVIDRYLFNRSLEKLVYPKGLDRNTMRKIKQQIDDFPPERQFSSDEIANLTGISRVTARRYLEFLTEKEILNKEYQYGLVGRPLCMYCRTGTINENGEQNEQK